MFAEKGMRVINDIYYMMKINLCWFLFTLEGGIVLGIVPATLTAFDCIRDKMKNNYDGKVYREFKQFYWANFKSSWKITLSFAAAGFILLVETAMLNGVGQSNVVIEIMLKLTRMLIVLTMVFFFPVYSHFDVHGFRAWLQPFLFLFICPLQVVLIVLMIAVTALLYMINPLLVFFLGIGLPAYVIMGMMLRKFNKLAEKVPAIHEV
ncbi:YesL family protein [Lacticaseibacillus mingshuiensis]|uniref:YesL family protein n=1 Tax=Lacticaseibacillus mingshuiensis TaxID=2799574 RepID=A0ABW4CJN5_9LACO|nr:DUF624 domain-containing protein [Lacticaseibacillus mingshuiensis]